MKELIIIGAGGMGRQVFDLAKQCIGYDSEYIIKGFIDFWPNPENEKFLIKKGYPRVLGTIREYQVKDNDVFICSTGDVKYKKESVGLILEKGGEFISLIHKTAEIGSNVQIGQGSIIMKNVYIGSDSLIGNYALIQISSVIGHDVQIGQYTRIDCNVVCTGGTRVKDDVTIHTAAVINHNVVLEEGAIVGSGSFVIRNVKERTTVYGNPAKRLW